MSLSSIENALPNHVIFEIKHNAHKSFYETLEHYVNSLGECLVIGDLTDSLWIVKFQDLNLTHTTTIISDRLELIFESLGISDAEFLLKKLPKYDISLSINHNPHKDSTLTILELIDFLNLEDDDWTSVSEKEKAISSNSLWEIQWYPDTPIGFYRSFSSSLESLFDRQL